MGDGIGDLLMQWFCFPFVEMMVEAFNKISQTGFISIFAIEHTLGINSSIINNVSIIIGGTAFSLLSLKLVFKLLNIYIFGVDGDNTVSPFEYVKSYIKGVFIISTFSVLYTWLGDIATTFSEDLISAIGQGAFSYDDKIDGWVILFMTVYGIFFIIFYINLVITGLRMLFLRLSIPLACVGLIDNDNGIYSVFMKKIFQTVITALSQLCIMQLSFIPIRALTGVEDWLGILGFILGIATLAYSTKLPNDLNEIFLASPISGAGQKMSAIGRGIQTAVSVATKL